MNAYIEPTKVLTPAERVRKNIMDARAALDAMLIANEQNGQPVTPEMVEALKLSVFPLLKFPEEQAPESTNMIDPADQDAINANIEKIARGEMVVGK